MSLTNLIKNLHKAQGRPSLSNIIERFFMEKANEFDEEKFKDRLTRFHPSSISYWGVCPRAYYLANKQEELGLELQKPQPFETSLLRIFEHGHSIHSLYQDKVLGPARVLYGNWGLKGEVVEGFQPTPEWIYIEPRMWWPEKKISGYCDGYLHIDGSWYVLEIKSSNDQSFRYLKRGSSPRPYHTRQAQLYMLAPNLLEKSFDIEGAIILYVNKDTGEELEFFIENDSTLVEPLLDQIDIAIDALDQSVIPTRVEECKTVRSKRAKDCKVCNACFGLGSK